MRYFVWLILAALPCRPAGHSPLVPQPQEVRYGNGQFALSGLKIRFAAAPSAEDRFAANELSAALSSVSKTPVPVGEGSDPARAILLTRTGDGSAMPGADDRTGPDTREAYTLKITGQGGEIRATSSAGLYYGIQTMRQLVEGTGDEASLPAVEIRDWPSLPYRGFMMDTSHGPLPTVREIERQIDFLARWKANQYYFYSEASIEVRGYPLVNPGARYSQEEIKGLIAYARERHVDIVPCMEFYGHLHDLFRVERYSDIAALRYGGEFNPHHPKAKALLEDWVGQMAELFPSPWFHIGFDEPWALELIGSQAAGGVPPQKLFMEHFQTVGDIVRKHGKRLMFWADMISGARIFSKYPELIAELPPGTIAVPWHYHVEKDYTPIVEPLARAKLPIVVAPAVWNWNEVVPSFQTSFDNITGMLNSGRKYQAIGLLNTGWTDDAQILYRMSLPGMAFGAAAPWQSAPLDGAQFFTAYARQMYSPAVATEVAEGLTALTKSQQTFSAVLDEQTMHRFWDDPFVSARLERLQAKENDLRQARLSAEDAQEHLQRAMDLGGDPATLSSLVLGARMLDYLGMKNLYAIAIAGYFRQLEAKPSREMAMLLLRQQTGSQNHGILGDLIDASMELRELYRTAWLAEYRPYRLGSALGRWDAEYEYWRSMQARVQETMGRLKPGEPLPPLEAFRPRSHAN